MYVPPDSYSVAARPAAIVASLPLGEVRAVDVSALAFSEEDAERINESLEFPLLPETTPPSAVLVESILGDEREFAPAFAAHEAAGGGWEARARSTLAERPVGIRASPVILQQVDSPQATLGTASDELTDGLEGEDILQAPRATEGGSLPALSATSTPPSLSSFSVDDPLSSHLLPGTLFAATLTRDVVVTERSAGQVIADSPDDWCGRASCADLRWVGTATLADSGRLSVRFRQAYLDGSALGVEGVAFGIDGAEGLPAHLADATPTLLTDLVRAGAGGVGDYVDAASRQRTITAADGTILTEANLPDLIDFVLGRAASAVQLPAEQTRIVRLATVEAGTVLEVFLK